MLVLITDTDCNCGMRSIESLDSNQISLHFTELNSFLLTGLKIKSGISFSLCVALFRYSQADYTPNSSQFPLPQHETLRSSWFETSTRKNFTDVLRLDWFQRQTLQGQTPVKCNKFHHLLINLLVDIDGKGRKYLCAKRPVMTSLLPSMAHFPSHII